MCAGPVYVGRALRACAPVLNRRPFYYKRTGGLRIRRGLRACPTWLKHSLSPWLPPFTVVLHAIFNYLLFRKSSIEN